MMKLALAITAFVVIVIFVPSLTARVQTPTRFEYATAAPYVYSRTQGVGIAEAQGYRACVATLSQWTCRQFEQGDSSSAAALATLGNEGWSLSRRQMRSRQKYIDQA